MRTISIGQRAIAFGVAGMLSLAVVAPTWAAPVPSSTAVIKSVAAGDVVNVGWRGRGFGRGIGAGIAAGAALGIIAGIAGARPYYYDYAPAYADPYYAAPYYSAPPVIYEAPPAYAAPEQAYVDPSQFYYAAPPRPGAVRQCWIATDDARGFGYWRPC